MKLFFCTDFHLGLTRTENTTQASAARLQEHIFQTGLNLVRAAAKRGERVINVGDLFHKYSNPEAIIKQGIQIAQYCDVVLAGNHDVLNIKGSVSSLDLVAAACWSEANEQTPVIVSPNPSEPYFEKRRVLDAEVDHGVEVYAVPHCFTQEIFEQSVRKLCAQVGLRTGHVLILHCNVGTGFGHLEADSSSLWLTEELQTLVSKSFAQVFIGHEHDPKVINMPDGGCDIHVMGNLFPVAFGEISNRFAYTYDVATNEVTQTKIFDAAANWAVIGADYLIASEGKWEMSEAFIEIEDEIDAEDAGKLSRAIGNLWKTNEATALMIRNATTIRRSEAAAGKDVTTTVVSLVERVRTQAAAAGFEAELNELNNEVAIP